MAELRHTMSYGKSQMKKEAIKNEGTLDLEFHSKGRGFRFFRLTPVN